MTNGTEVQGTPSEEQKTKKEGWVNSFFSKIGDQLEDLTYVSVITGTGNTYATITPGNEIVEELKKGQVIILARTNIELDGDITVIVPTKGGQDFTVNQEIMTIHKENTTVAVENWNNFMNTILKVIDVIAELAGIQKANIADKLALSYKGPPA